MHWVKMASMGNLRQTACWESIGPLPHSQPEGTTRNIAIHPSYLVLIDQGVEMSIKGCCACSTIQYACGGLVLDVGNLTPQQRHTATTLQNTETNSVSYIACIQPITG